jgi:hypothetical protein
MKPRWHPWFAAEEREPGVWTLVDSMGRDYGVVRIVRVGSEVGYTAVMRDTPVGRFTTLRAGLEAVHGAFIRDHAPGGFAPNPWPTNEQSQS